MTWAKQIKTPLYITLVVLAAGLIMLAFDLHNYATWHMAGLVCSSIALVIIIQLLVFFRDPRRYSNAPADHILAPADGQVMAVELCEESRHIRGPAWRIATFMHVGNVHIQRMPVGAGFLWQKHFPGKYLPAFDQRAAKMNEQRVFAFERDGHKLTLVQIAGLLARRTQCWLDKEPHEVARNTKIGMITLGSEVDLYLPVQTKLTVKKGDKVKAGETVIGYWSHAV